MTRSVAELDGLPEPRIAELLEACCGSRRWVTGMLARRPFQNRERLFSTAAEIWRTLHPADWLEAFAHHPRIGERAQRSTVPQSERGQAWSAGEQAGMKSADDPLRQALAAANQHYEARFGHILIVCAAGKSAAELLALAQERLGNDADTELAVAAHEQEKIMLQRLQKLLDSSD